MHQRKLLGYEQNFCAHPIRHYKSNGMHRVNITTRSQLTKRKHRIAPRDIEPTGKNTGEIEHIDFLINLIDNTYFSLCQNVV